jgi:LPS export ABC transporter protein LptC
MIDIRSIKSTNSQSVSTLVVSRFFVFSIFFLLFFVSCNKDQPDKISAVKNRNTIPKLHATEITTVISDSGVTRYRITAQRWDVFDKAIQPYQEFSKGVYFEKFDLNMKVEANIRSNYARFNENEKLWDLRGKVRAMNLQGELFETERLFWNQNQERFYSDTLVKITQKTRIITGIGFESNQSMTKYQIKRPQGIFPVDEKAEQTTPTQPVITPVSTPTIKSGVPSK